MRTQRLLSWFVMAALFTGALQTTLPALAASSKVYRPAQVTAFELILAMNTLRSAYGLPLLIEDPIVNAVAQATAETMAANQMSWHIGDVRGRLAAAGYGGGATVWATENFAVGNMSIDEIMVVWADPDHMRPAVEAAYCHVGAGTAQAANGMTYYVLQAAYVGGQACGSSSGGGAPGGSVTTPGARPVSQVIVPVKIATPGSDGKTIHVVEAGQSFWAIAVAYQITIRDIEIWNNLSRNTALQIGQRLLIPTGNLEGYATPTPVGMVVPATPDAEGKIVHTVEPYHTLITIAAAYGVTVETILNLNGIQEDWPLQVGQKLLISPGRITPSPTPQPLTPLELLTPASDGKYYHVVQSGETLSWIASLYEIALADLMAWNGLNSNSIIVPNQTLLLQVTPPATVTATAAPLTATATLTPSPRPPTATRAPSPTLSPPTPTATPDPGAQPLPFDPLWLLAAALIVAGLFALGWVLRRNRPPA